jgi:hypothetical protein
MSKQHDISAVLSIAQRSIQDSPHEWPRLRVNSKPVRRRVNGAKQVLCKHVEKLSAATKHARRLM